MSLEINQITSFNAGNFLLDTSSASSITCTPGIDTEIPFFTMNFTDSYLTINNNGVAGFKENTVYYLEASLSPNSNFTASDSTDLIRDVTIKLWDRGNNIEQYIDDFKIFLNSSDGNENYVYNISIMFKPIANFTRLYFLINRNINDLRKINESSSETSVQNDYLVINSAKIFQLSNGLSNTQIAKIYKMGIQGTPGLLMCINGEAVRIGPSGIYEIKNGYKITFLKILKRTNSERFILDYLLDTSNQSES